MSIATLQRRRGTLMGEIAKLRKQHRRKRHMTVLLVRMTTLQIRQELRHEHQ